MLALEALFLAPAVFFFLLFVLDLVTGKSSSELEPSLKASRTFLCFVLVMCKAVAATRLPLRNFFFVSDFGFC